MTYGEHIEEITARINKLQPPRIREFVASQVLLNVLGKPTGITYVNHELTSTLAEEQYKD